MSKFIDRLKQLSEGTPQPIGFKTGSFTPSKLKLQLIWTFQALSTKIDQEIIDISDAYIISAVTPDKFSKISFGSSTKPYGVVVTPDISEDMETAMKAEVDFAVFSPDLPFITLPNKGIGKILEIEPTISDSLLRALNTLSVDGLMINYQLKKEKLSWLDLLEIRRLTTAITKPVLMPVPAELTSRELQTIWEAGIDGIVVDISEKEPGKLKELRSTIDKLEPPNRNQRDRMPPSIPRMTAESVRHEEEEEEEDDE